MAMDDDEAKKLAIAIKNVQRHYPISVQQKHLDWGALIVALGTIYGTRFAAIRIRTMTEKRERQEEARRNAGVVDFVPNRA